MTGILCVFIFSHLLLTSNGIHLYICEACLDLHHCTVEALSWSELLIPGDKDFVDAVLVSSIFFSFQSCEVF